jgi:hypothetical protein
MINVQQSLRKEKREKRKGKKEKGKRKGKKKKEKRKRKKEKGKKKRKKEKEKKRPKLLILVAHAKNSLEGKSEFWADRLPHSIFHHATGLISSY